MKRLDITKTALRILSLMKIYVLRLHLTKPVAVGDKVDFGFKFTLRSSVVFFVVGTLETDGFDRCSRRILKDKKAKCDRFYYQSNMQCVSTHVTKGVSSIAVY